MQKPPSHLPTLTLVSLVLLIVGAVDSIRNLPVTALFGTTLIFFFLISALIFLIPSALISAELASAWPEEGGIYHWIEKAFGDKWAFLAVWFQWINTATWYPSILAFMAGTAAYFFNPEYAHNKFYLVTVILSVFWILTFINLKGIHISGRTASFCALIGLVIPMILIIGMAFFWILLGKPLAIQFNLHDIFPNLHEKENWISLTAIMASFLGMELTAVHVNRIDHPTKTFPQAMFFSVIIILLTMILGSLSIALVLPLQEIHLTSGVMETFTRFFKVYHMSGMIPVIVILLLAGSFGGMINWIVSPAKSLLQTAQAGYLPRWFSKENKNGVAGNILVAQAVVVSFVCLAFILMPSINGSYWLLTALTTQIYMLVYVILFIAAIRLRYKYPHQPRPFKVPGGRIGIWIISLLGLLGCAMTLLVGFFPPSGIQVGSYSHYLIVFSSGMVMMAAPVFLFYEYKRRRKIKIT